MSLSISGQTDRDKLLDTDVSALLLEDAVDILQELRCRSSSKLDMMLEKFKFKVELKLPTLFLTIPLFSSPYSKTILKVQVVSQSYSFENVV